MAQRGNERVVYVGAEGVGIVWNKLEGKLFRQYTRNARETKLTECQFADAAAKTGDYRCWC